MTRQKENLEEVKLFVIRLMNEEQDNHSKTIDALKKALGDDLSQDSVKVINEIYKAKAEVLSKVYDKIQSL